MRRCNTGLPLVKSERAQSSDRLGVRHAKATLPAAHPAHPCGHATCAHAPAHSRSHPTPPRTSRRASQAEGDAPRVNGWHGMKKTAISHHINSLTAREK